jgi:hypothetical protein
MVNAKNVAFTVNKQTPFMQTPDQAYATVINCRPAGGKRMGLAPHVRSHNVPMGNVQGSLKRKRGDEGKKEFGQAIHVFSGNHATTATTPPTTTLARPLLSQQWPQRKPTRLKRGKILSKSVDMDCWFIILSFSEPAQLLEMRSKIASCYRLLRDYPTLWKRSRDFYYGADMPDPPSDVTEFQFAHLRHGHGCMRCNTANTRKTYWAFLRRMCKSCLASEVIREYEAMALLKGENGEDLAHLRKYLPTGIFDSWGNFGGVGPATTHALKTVYFRSDVEKLVAEYSRELGMRETGSEDMRVWLNEWHAAKVKAVEERQVFAKKMEQWEDTTRMAKTSQYNARKAARKAFYKEKALQLIPPISEKELEKCASYKRAITIPKEPNNTSWDLLKPKIVKEAADLAAREDSEESRPPTATASGMSTPTSSLNNQLQHTHHYLATILGQPVPGGHMF